TRCCATGRRTSSRRWKSSAWLQVSLTWHRAHSCDPPTMPIARRPASRNFRHWPAVQARNHPYPSVRLRGRESRDARADMKLPHSLLILALATPLALFARPGADTIAPGPTADQATTAKLVYGLLSDSRYAYRPQALDDALSKDIFKRYLDALDRSK